MIGIPILDNLSEDDLCLVSRGIKEVHVLEKISLQTSIEDKPPSYLIPFVEMSKDKIITLCKMEIESRLGWIYLRELLDAEHIQPEVKMRNE